MDGVVNDVPVPNDAPPVGFEYQLIKPADELAPSVTVPKSHIAAGVVEVIAGVVLTVAIT